ncbi:terpene synthase family protein [Amycolatopsis samaneae]|uniref:Terpene synthase n=1 Tax=Amycolatopsis samaneae TaxID=664691 RepID=A0ABW5GWI6_9PSEU
MTRTTPMEVPPFYCPIPPAQHPRAHEVQQDAVEWARTRGFEPDPARLARLARGDLGGLAAKSMPEAEFEPLTVVAHWYMLVFSFDDTTCDETPATTAGLCRRLSLLQRVLEAPSPAWPDENPYTEGFRDLRVSWGRLATPVQVRRWIEGKREFFSGLVWESTYRASGALPGVNEYVTMWLRAVGMIPLMTMLDAVRGYELPPAELERPVVRALVEMAGTLVAWDNDLISRAKEIHRAGDTLNLLDVLAVERGLSLEAARDAVVAMRDRVMVMFLRLAERVSAGACQELRDFVSDLGRCVRGHLDWALTCDRYRHPSGNHLGPVVRLPTEFAERPADDRAQPLPLPTLAWWWDL